MSLQPGTTLGPYSVTAKIGEGGMGEVYRARDTKLDRDVALKVLPQAFTDDPDRLARFEREAKVLASLNHPNIGGIHGLEESDGIRALVLEYIEGPTLADRIAQGPIPVDEAIPIAKQIAEALEAAHEAGVIHRDLKPANIKVKDDGTVKVLDFGLAKAFQPEASDASQSMSPTISLTAAATQMGMVIGTAAYMAPEQAKGKVVDKRADAWAFGVVLYEMLAGRRPFVGDDVSETLARVIDREPDWDALPENVPPVLRAFLTRCLHKDPKKRIRDIGDVGLALEGAFESTVTTSDDSTRDSRVRFWQRPVWLVLAGSAVAVIIGLSVWTTQRLPVAVPTRLTVSAPPGVLLTGSMELSPDGRTLAFHGSAEGRGQVYLRSLDQFEALPLPEAEETIPVAFSRDGSGLLVVDADLRGVPHGDSSIKQVSLQGGPATMIAAGRGATWGPGDDLIVGGFGVGLSLVSMSGGEAVILTTLAEGERGHIFPRLLPNGRAVLFQVWTGSARTSQVSVYELETGRRATLFPGARPHFATSGHLVFWRDGSLWGVPFDQDRVEVVGNPVAVVQDVARYVGTGAYALAPNGTLVYLAASSNAGWTWLDRAGRAESVGLADVRNAIYPRLSPGGSRVVFDEDSVSGRVIWVQDLERGSVTLITRDGISADPSWSPDGTKVVFSSRVAGSDGTDVYTAPADGSGALELVVSLPGEQWQPVWTPDGEMLVFQSEDDIWVLPSDGEPIALVSEEGSRESRPAVSPNGRWLAHTSDRTGRVEVYVTTLPDGAGQETVSVGGGTDPAWSGGGRQLYYRRGAEWWEVNVETGPTFVASQPQLLFGRAIYEGGGNRSYDVAADGRFLASTVDSGESPIRIVLNWHEELLERVPIP